ncbi:hypothetical protein C8F01DRAFT_1082551 [Mycena amicta]|nr:hypothetical protein C8F01DRAFT_1082551 [Mycena amicta]
MSSTKHPDGSKQLYRTRCITSNPVQPTKHTNMKTQPILPRSTGGRPDSARTMRDGTGESVPPPSRRLRSTGNYRDDDTPSSGRGEMGSSPVDKQDPTRGGRDATATAKVQGRYAPLTIEDPDNEDADDFGLDLSGDGEAAGFTAGRSPDELSGNLNSGRARGRETAGGAATGVVQQGGTRVVEHSQSGHRRPSTQQRGNTEQAPSEVGSPARPRRQTVNVNRQRTRRPGPRSEAEAPEYYRKKLDRQQRNNPAIARKTRANLKLAAYNINGTRANSLRSPQHKWHDLHRMMLDDKLGVVVISETHLPAEQAEEICHETD